MNNNDPTYLHTLLFPNITIVINVSLSEYHHDELCWWIVLLLMMMMMVMMMMMMMMMMMRFVDDDADDENKVLGDYPAAPGTSHE